MHILWIKPPTVFIFVVLFTTLLPPAVRSDPNPLQLLPDQAENDICRSNSNPDNCPVNCFRPDPVCGVDGVTYWCGCIDAQCAGVRVMNLGHCKVGNGGRSGTAGQALLLIHIIWLILLGVFAVFGLL